jgi:hypothetical protein
VTRYGGGYAQAGVGTTTNRVRVTIGLWRLSQRRFLDRRNRCGGWYVDFVRPYRRTAFGVDTFDLFLDLVVEASLSGYRWKDEDEYAQGERLGLIDDALHQHLDAARQQVIALIESRHGPFAEDWSSWSRNPTWPSPLLPVESADW